VEANLSLNLRNRFDEVSGADHARGGMASPPVEAAPEAQSSGEEMQVGRASLRPGSTQNQVLGRVRDEDVLFAVGVVPEAGKPVPDMKARKPVPDMKARKPVEARAGHEGEGSPEARAGSPCRT
jgi:hypothetical protein